MIHERVVLSEIPILVKYVGAHIQALRQGRPTQFSIFPLAKEVSRLKRIAGTPAQRDRDLPQTRPFALAR